MIGGSEHYLVKVDLSTHCNRRNNIYLEKGERSPLKQINSPMKFPFKKLENEDRNQ